MGYIDDFKRRRSEDAERKKLYDENYRITRQAEGRKAAISAGRSAARRDARREFAPGSRGPGIGAAIMGGAANINRYYGLDGPTRAPRSAPARRTHRKKQRRRSAPRNQGGGSFGLPDFF